MQVKRDQKNRRIDYRHNTVNKSYPMIMINICLRQLAVVLNVISRWVCNTLTTCAGIVEEIVWEVKRAADLAHTITVKIRNELKSVECASRTLEHRWSYWQVSNSWTLGQIIARSIASYDPVALKFLYSSRCTIQNSRCIECNVLLYTVWITLVHVCNGKPLEDR